MAKKNKNNKNAPSNNVNIILPDSLSAEEMQQIITNALLAVEDAKEQNAKEQKEQERKNFRCFHVFFLSFILFASLARILIA